MEPIFRQEKEGIIELDKFPQPTLTWRDMDIKPGQLFVSRKVKPAHLGVLPRLLSFKLRRYES